MKGSTLQLDLTFISCNVTTHTEFLPTRSIHYRRMLKRLRGQARNVQKQSTVPDQCDRYMPSKLKLTESPCKMCMTACWYALLVWKVGYKQSQPKSTQFHWSVLLGIGVSVQAFQEFVENLQPTSQHRVLADLVVRCTHPLWIFEWKHCQCQLLATARASE